MKISLKIILLLVFIQTNCFSQYKVFLKFKDGLTVTDSVYSKKNKLYSLREKVEYDLNFIEEIKVVVDLKILHIYMLDVKIFKSDRNTRNVFASKIHETNKLIFYNTDFRRDLSFFIQDYKNNAFSNSRPGFGIYAKKKNERITYNIGCVDGLGCVKVKTRLKAFFNDCPELQKLISKGKIKKYNYLELADFYDKSCGNIKE